MDIALGTKNEAKAKWVKEAVLELSMFDSVFPQYSYHSVETGVSDTPLSLEEAILWAKNRAQALADDERVDADYYIWLEWAVTKIWDDPATYIYGYVYALNKFGRWYGWFSPLMILPDNISHLLYEEWKDLGEITGKLSGDSEISQTLGSFGYYSDKIMTRDESFKIATKMAFVPFSNDHKYR